MTGSDSHTDVVRRFVADLAAGRFEAAASGLDGMVGAQLGPAQLADVWAKLQRQAGPFKELGSVAEQSAGRGTVVVAVCVFEGASLDLKVAFGADGSMAALLFAPHDTPAAGPPPPYARPERFSETEVVVGAPPWELPGTLTMPAGEGPFPGVVLVHGSGPHDRDETIGPNRPFRDLAWGLASQGIAVLRYEKRTKVYGARMAAEQGGVTVQTEVVEDAVHGAALLRATPRVAAGRVFALGHSLGGYCAPRIGRADPRLAGLIILAGSALPLEETILSQIAYVLPLGGAPEEAIAQQMAALRAQVARVQSADLRPDTPATDLPLGIPAEYWLDLRGYDPVAVARELPQPLLILQAESDYQVTMDDFARWRAGPAGRPDVEFKSYPGLYHLFMPVAGGARATPEAYGVADHVAAQVVDDIGAWIRRH